jgi:predicted MFS family arabinose efflux permease
VLIAGRAPAGIVCLLLALIVARVDDPGLVVASTYAVSALAGLGWALGVPAGHAFTPALVERQSLTAAITLTAMTGHISRMVGPAVTGALLVLGEVWMAFAVAGAGHLVFVLVLLRLRTPVSTRATGDRSRVIDGVRYVLSKPRLLIPILAGVIVSLGLEPMVTLGPALAVELGREGAAATTLATAFGAGAVSVVALLGRVQRRFGLERSAIIGMLTVGVGLGMVMGLTTLAAASFAFAVAGAGSTIAVVSLQSWIQHLVDDAYRGRVMSLWALSFLGSRTLSATLLGWLGDAFGAGIASSMAGLGCAVGVLLVLAGRRSSREG